MSILIRGMEMPKNCRECPFYYPFICMARDENIAEDCNPVKSRDKDCPLIELPLHGDLIERKTAYESLLCGMVMTGYQSQALACIDEFFVPTIIEAEEEK